MEQPPMYRRPEIPVVGSGGDKRKQEISNRIQKNLNDNRDILPTHALEELELNEYPKQDFERTAIHDINAELNAVLSELGIAPFDVPEENIYIVPQNIYKRLEGGNGDNGITLPSYQSIVLNAEALDSRYPRLSTLLHEMIHLKSFLSIEASEKSNKFRRVGLEVHSTLKKTGENDEDVRQFTGLDEAVVSTLQKKLLGKVIDRNPFLKKEKEATEKGEYKELLKKVATKQKFSEDELIYVRAVEEGRLKWHRFSYGPQRKVLDYIINVVQKANPDRFPSPEDVFQLFLQAHFTGRVLPLARVIESTFGPDSFRMIGTMTGKDDESAYRVLAYLQKKTHPDLRHE